MLAGSVVTQVLLYLLILGIVVVFHELGHFLAAKLVGVEVEVFSFGFGRRIVGRRIGGTDYRVSLFPLGGYVRMRGDGSTDARGTSRRDFDGRRSWEKLLIMFMGPAFNLVLAVVLLAAALMVGHQVPAYLKAPVLVEFVEPGSPAEAAGLRVGDVIREIDGRPVRNWEEFRNQVLVRPGARVRLAVEREGAPKEVALEIVERTKHAIGHVGVHPCLQVVVRRVNEGSPAEVAGLRTGDVLQQVGGQRACTVDVLVDSLQSGAGAPLELVLRRSDGTVTASVRPQWNDALKKWLIGIAPAEVAAETVIVRETPAVALRESVAKNWDYTLLLGTIIGRLVTGRLSVRTMSGPMELASIAEETASLGVAPFLELMSFISLNLAIFNLLPVAPLDGGRIAILMVEAVRGRDLQQRTKDWMLQLGFVMILVLVGVLVYFDLVKKVEG